MPSTPGAGGPSCSTQQMPAFSALDAVDAALHAVLGGCAHPDDLTLITRLIDQVAMTGSRTAASPEVPIPDALPSPITPTGDAAGAGPGDVPSATLHGLPPTPALLRSLDVLLSMVGPTARVTRTQSDIPSRVSQVRVAAGADVRAKLTAAKLPLGIVNRDRLLSTVSALSTALGAWGRCILVGQTGAGKSLAWRSLIAAASGLDTLLGPAPPGTQPQLVHVYPEALPQTAHWAQVLVEGWQPWQVRARAAGAVASRPNSCSGATPPSAQQQRVLVAPAGPAGPSWLVLDGPLGAPASDALLPLLMGGCKLQSSGQRQVVQLRPGTRVIWECSSLAGATPALLSCIPVVRVASPVVDDTLAIQESVLAAVKALLLTKTLLGGGITAGQVNKAAAALARPPASLFMAMLARVSAALAGPSVPGASPPTPPDAPSTAAQPAAKPPPAPSLGIEHGSVLVASATRSALALFSQVLRELDVPHTQVGLGCKANCAACLGFLRSLMHHLYVVGAMIFYTQHRGPRAHQVMKIPGAMECTYTHADRARRAPLPRGCVRAVLVVRRVAAGAGASGRS